VSHPAFRSGLQVRTSILIALTVLLNSAGNVFLSVGMKRVGEIHRFSLGDLAAAGLMTAANASIWIGIALLALFLVSYLLVLSWADYSYVHPASAFGYALVPLLAYAVAGDQVSPVRWGGVLLICLGVLLVGRTPVRTTDQD
jgi:uncharacterized membrane protein